MTTVKQYVTHAGAWGKAGNRAGQAGERVFTAGLKAGRNWLRGVLSLVIQVFLYILNE